MALPTTIPRLKAQDVLPNNGWDGDITNSSDPNYHQAGVLLGDANGNGKTDAGEDTLFVSLAAAQQIISSSDSTNDTRQILMSQALAAQLNIDNAFQTGTQAKEPLDLVGEAVKWLKGDLPYQYTDGSSGKVDTNHNGILDVGEYNTSTKAFTFDANGAASGTALTSNLQAWQSYVDVVGSATSHSEVDDFNAGTEANGEGLKNALMWFNQNQLVISSDGASV